MSGWGNIGWGGSWGSWGPNPAPVGACNPITTIVAPNLGQWGVGQWGVLPWGGSGLGISTQVTGGGAPTVTSITPNSGTTLGSTSISITGTELACFSFNDIFSDAVVSPMLWWPMGAGTVSETPLGLGGKLRCTVPAVANTIAGVLGLILQLKEDFHVEVEYAVSTEFLKLTSSAEIVLAALQASCDADNGIQISFVMKAGASTGTVRCEVRRLGAIEHTFEVDTTAATGKFGVMRYFDPVYNGNKAAFWWNGAKLFECFDCPAGTALVSIFNQNNLAAYAIETQFDNFKSHSVIVFIGPSGTDVATDVIEVSALKLRAKTPPTLGQWAGLVSVRVTNGSGNNCFALASMVFSYQFPEAFVVGRSEPYRPTRKEISLVNDGVLRNPNQNIGHGLRRQS